MVRRKARTTRVRRHKKRYTRKRRGGFTNSPVTVIRFWMEGCGACAASEEAWTQFENDRSDDSKKVKIERSAIPPEWDGEVEAFPTYIVVVDGKKVAKEQGAITDASKLRKLAAKGKN